MTDVQAAEFPSIRSNGGGGRTARRGADAFERRGGRRQNAQRRPDSGFFAHMESPRLSLVRAARLGPRPHNQLVPLAGAAAAGSGRFAGLARQQGGHQQLRPTGRRLQKSNSSALGGGSG